MSVKEELVYLEQARENLKKKLVDISSTLYSLSVKKNLLEPKVETLKTRHSSLAQKLLEQTQIELDVLNQEIATAQKEKAKLERDLKENQTNTSKRIHDTTLYIQEQCNLMVSSFLEYLRNNLETIGLETKKTYKVMEVTHFKDELHGDCDVPTSCIGIYDEGTQSFIIYSSDFCFTNHIYTLRRWSHDCSICDYTKFYIEYRNRFISVFLETLEKSYTYGELYSLTIEGSRFTLELV